MFKGVCNGILNKKDETMQESITSLIEDETIPDEHSLTVGSDHGNGDRISSKNDSSSSKYKPKKKQSSNKSLKKVIEVQSDVSSQICGRTKNEIVAQLRRKAAENRRKG